MHSFHHSSSPMHLPAAADALVVLADNDAGDALVAASVIDVAGFSLGILPATHYPNPKNPDPNPKNPNPHYPCSLRVANHKTRSFCGYFGLRTPVPEDPNPLDSQTDFQTPSPHRPAATARLPQSPVPTRTRTRAPEVNSLRDSVARLLVPRPRLHRFITQTQPRRAPDPNSPWRLLTCSPLRINLAAGRCFKLPNSRVQTGGEA
jgi:hypothetical protein